MSDSCQATTGQQNSDSRAKVSMEYTRKKSCISSIDSSSCWCCWRRCFCSLFSRWIYRSQTRYRNINQTIRPTILEKLITLPVAAVAVDVRLEMHKISEPHNIFSRRIAINSSDRTMRQRPLTVLTWQNTLSDRFLRENIRLFEWERRDMKDSSALVEGILKLIQVANEVKNVVWFGDLESHIVVLYIWTTSQIELLFLWTYGDTSE